MNGEFTLIHLLGALMASQWKPIEVAGSLLYKALPPISPWECCNKHCEYRRIQTL